MVASSWVLTICLLSYLFFGCHAVDYTFNAASGVVGDFNDPLSWLPVNNYPKQVDNAEINCLWNVTVTSPAICANMKIGCQQNVVPRPGIIFSSILTVRRSLTTTPTYKYFLTAEAGQKGGIEVLPEFSDACTIPSLTGFCINIVGDLYANGGVLSLASTGADEEFSDFGGKPKNVYITGNVGINSGTLAVVSSNTTVLFEKASITMQGANSTLSTTFSRTTGPFYLNILSPISILGKSLITTNGIITMNTTLTVNTAGPKATIEGLSLSGNGTYSVLSGTLELATKSFLTSTSIAVSAGSVVSLKGTSGTTSADIQLNGPVVGGGTVEIPTFASVNAGANGITFNITGNKAITFQGAYTLSKFYIVPGATVTVAGTSSTGYYQVNGSLSITNTATQSNPMFMVGPGATVTVAGPTTNGGFNVYGTLSLNPGTTHSAPSMSVYSGTATIANTTSGNFTLGGGSLVLSDDTGSTISGAVNGATATISGSVDTIFNGKGSLTLLKTHIRPSGTQTGVMTINGNTVGANLVIGGTLTLGASTAHTSGTFTVNSGATMNVIGSTSGCKFIVSGTLVFSSSSDVLNIEARSGSNVTFTVVATAANVTVATGGSVSFSSDCTNCIFDNQGTVALSSSSAKQLKSVSFKNNGNLRFNGGTVTLVDTNLNNLASGKIYLDGANVVNGGQGSITNAGALLKTVSGSVTINVPLVNSGQLQIQAGSVTMGAQFTCTGTAVISAGASLKFANEDRTFDSTCPISGTGTLGFKNMTVTVESQFGSVKVELEGTMVIAQDQIISGFTFISGAINGSGHSFQVTGTMTWQAGVLNVPLYVGSLSVTGDIQISSNVNATSVILSSGADIAFSLGATLYVSTFVVASSTISAVTQGTVIVSGQLTVNTNLYIAELVTLSNQGTITIAPGAKLTANDIICGGAVQVGSGASFNVGSKQTLVLDCPISGAGSLGIVGSSVVIPGPQFSLSYIELTQSTLEMQRAITITGLTFYSSTFVTNYALKVDDLNANGTSVFTGDGSVDVVGDVIISEQSELSILSNGTINTSGTLTVERGAAVIFGVHTVWTIGNGVQITGAGSVVSYGHVDLSSNVVSVQNLVLAGNTTLLASIVDSPNISVANVEGSGPVALQALTLLGGLLNKFSVTSQSTIISGAVSFNNSIANLGNVSVSADGTLSAVSGSEFTIGSLRILAGASLTVSAVKLILDGNTQLEGDLSFANTALTCNGGFSLAGGVGLVLTGSYIFGGNCKIDGTGNVTVAGKLEVTATTVSAGSFVALNSNVTFVNSNLATAAFSLIQSLLLAPASSTISVSGQAVVTDSTLQADTTFNAGSTTIVSGATKFLNCDLNTQGNLVWKNGTMDNVEWVNTGSFTGPTSTFAVTNTHLDIYSGSLSVTDMIIAELNWFGGELWNGKYTVGSVITALQKTRAVATTTRKVVGATLIVSGNTTLTEVVVLQNATLTNSPNSLLSITGSMNGSASFLINNGSVIITSQLQGVFVYNFGNITQTNTNVSLTNGGSFAGTWMIGSGSTLNFNGGSFTVWPNASISGNGSLVLSGGTANIQSPYNGTMYWSGGSVSSLELGSAGILIAPQSTFQRSVDGSLTNRGSMLITNGTVLLNLNVSTISNYGRLTINGNSSVGVSSSSGQTALGNVVNYGLFAISSSVGAPTLNTRITNYAAVIISSSSIIQYLVQIGGNASTTLINQPSVTTTSFTIGASSKLSGAGTFSGSVINSGNITVGNISSVLPTAQLSFSNFIQTGTGSIALDIVTNVAYDVATCSGTCSLNGTLVVNSEVPAEASNDAPVIFSYSSHSGVFRSVEYTNYSGEAFYGDKGLKFVRLGAGMGTTSSGSFVVDNGKDSLSDGGIAGIVVAGVFIICAAIVGGVLLMKRNRKAYESEMTALVPPSEQDAIEHSFLFYHHRITANDKKLRQIEALHAMLVENDMALVEAICAVTEGKEALSQVSPSLTYLLEAKGAYLRWFGQLLSLEVDNCQSEATLFRLDSLFTKSMTTYAVMAGTAYLYDMLFEPLKRVCVLAGIEDIDLAALKENPTKTAPLRTMELCMEYIFDALDGSLNKVPVHLRIMCNMIKEEVRKKYKEAELVALGGFFFLRFVGPPITEPEYFGIIKEGQDGTSKKAERSVGGLLLKIANNAEYSEKGKYPHLAILNPFIKTQYARLTKFLMAISKNDSNVGAPSPIEIPPNVLQVSLAYTYNKILPNMDKITFMLLRIPPPPANYQCPPNLQDLYSVHIAPHYAGMKPSHTLNSPSASSSSTPASPKPLLSSPSLNAPQYMLPEGELTSDEYTRLLQDLSSKQRDLLVNNSLLLTRLRTLVQDTGATPIEVQDPKAPKNKNKKK